MGISAPPPSWASIKNKPNTMGGFGITDGVQSLNGQTGAITNSALGAIGSYYQSFQTQTIANGATVSGSTLTYQDAAFSPQNAGLSGTWRKMGATNAAGANVGTQLFVRIA